MTPDEFKAIKKRHAATLLIDWDAEFHPDAQPHSNRNAKQCHADRGALLAEVDRLTTMNRALFVEHEAVCQLTGPDWADALTNTGAAYVAIERLLEKE